MRWLVAGALVMTGCAGGDPAASPLGSPSTVDTVSPAPSRPIDAPSTRSASSTTNATAPAAAPPPTDPGAVLPEGFDLVAARLTEPDGTVCELCLWLAEDGEQRRRGLMFVTDLGPAAGMAFRYAAPHTGSFWMKNTVLPLSIAFFGPGGAYVDAFDMEPCTADPCRRYPTPTDVLVAVETVQGGLDDLGMLPGSTLELLDSPCPSS